MTAEQLSAAVMNSVHRAGLVEVEVSARHVHLTKADAEVLFGIGAELEPVRPLSQPGQFASVNLPYDEIRAALVHDPS